MATTNRNFRVKSGLTVASEGITFSDGSTQTTASSGGLIVDSVFPNSPSNGQMHLNTVSNRIYYYYGSQWYALANHDDMQLNLVEHSHGDGGFIQDIYSYNGNGVSLPLVLDSWSPLDGGNPSSTYLVTIDGGAAA